MNMNIVKRIRSRIEQLQETEEALTVAGPAGAQVLVQKQAEIQEYYYADVSDLLEELERAVERVSKAEIAARKLRGHLKAIALIPSTSAASYKRMALQALKDEEADSI
ncbi:hypothetical protein [Brevibacillus laterosporus]|uniref:Uncharacterized protein n=1 Tax=Brevibacillus laterosporus TaxID=1465 RepID=A0AAP8QGK3_BRELA|nr:hypothetical protein [Brevibacillus laterosporus]PPB10892.1 hypothetical protein C4A77_04510 [Brevibacillus laterosporus]